MLSTCRCRPRSTRPTPRGSYSSETVPVSSLHLAAGRGAEEAVTVGACPARFTLAPIINATVAAAA